MIEQQTSAEQRAVLREKYGSRTEYTNWWGQTFYDNHADVLAAVDDADALAGSLVEAARLQALVDACIDVLGRAMVRSDGYSLHRAGVRVWEMLTGVPEAPAMKGAK